MGRLRIGGGLVVLALAVLGSLCWGNTAMAVTRADGQAYAARYCANIGYLGYQGVADYIWASAPDGNNTVQAIYGDPYVTIKINVTGRYCSGYIAPSAGSNYWTNVGGVSGSFNPYPNNGANNIFDDSQLQSLDISGWSAGWHTVCTDFSTWMTAPTKSSESVRICTDIYLDIIYPWDTQGSSLVGVNRSPNVSYWGSTRPGDTVYWRHAVRNVTPYSTDRMHFYVNRSGFASAPGGSRTPESDMWLAPWETGYVGYSPSVGWWGESPYSVTQADVGRRLCESLHWQPGRYDGAAGDTSAACTDVPYRFNLTPTVNAPTDTTEPGAPIGPINPTVTNSGPTKSYDNTSWQLSKFIVGPGGAIPAGADSSSDPCGYYKNGCVKLSNGSQTFMPGDTTVGSIASYTVDDAVMGSRLCFALSVNGYTDSQPPSPSRWRHGVPSCVMIGKKPKIQVWGSDVAARGGINVSLTQKTIGVFGSWVEYGAFSVGSNGRFASGAGLTPQPTPKGSPVQNDWSKLTFANVDASGSPRFGQYSGSASFRPQPNVAQYFNAVSNTSPFKGNKPGAVPNTFKTGDAIQVMTAGDLTLQGDTIPAGRSGVIIASGTVTITGDITYDPKPRTDLNGLSQLVIIAKNINITSGVSNVDAWLVTSDMHNGVVDTCSDHTPPLTGNVCNMALTIHGPVVAGELHLKRTGGSGTGPVDSATPAEVIDLRPDAYLWAQLIAGGAGKAETVYTTELPPRF